jgi:hypothetical protein
MVGQTGRWGLFFLHKIHLLFHSIPQQQVSFPQQGFKLKNKSLGGAFLGFQHAQNPIFIKVLKSNL